MLKFQDYIAAATESAAREVFKYAKAVPAEKLEWKPGDATRSIIDICRELAMTPTWAISIVDNQPMPSDEEMAGMKEVQESWITVQACEDQCLERLRPLIEVMRAIPDEKLVETKWLPYDGGRDFSMVEIMEYARWNFNYHLGQIAYVQLMYGDKEMH